MIEYKAKANYRSMLRRARSGFSLIELMIAITIIGILGALILPRFTGYLGRARVRGAKVMLQTIKNAITLYKSDVGEYPQRLKDLLKKPTEERIAKRWEGPYMDQTEIPEDPWGNTYKYDRTTSGYDLYSTGSNGPGSDKSEWIRAE